MSASEHVGCIGMYINSNLELRCFARSHGGEDILVTQLNGNGKPKRSYSVVEPKALNAGGTRDESICYALNQIFRFHTSEKTAISTASIDSQLRMSFAYVGSLSKKISNLRAYYRQQGIGELRCFSKYQDGKRICYYFLEKAST